jgi:hypothetical protein
MRKATLSSVQILCRLYHSLQASPYRNLLHKRNEEKNQADENTKVQKICFFLFFWLLVFRQQCEVPLLMITQAGGREIAHGVCTVYY